VLSEADAQVEIAGEVFAAAGLALAGEADALPFAHAFGDAPFVGLRFGAAFAAEGDFLFRAVEGFFEGDEEVGFDVAAFGRGLIKTEAAHGVAATAAAARAAAHAAAEELLEEIAEAGAF
jgi:hypothetical protein